MMVQFTVPGKPVGKARPRFTRAGHTYTPEKTAEYEALVRSEYARQTQNFRFPDGVPVKVQICAHYPIPASTSRKNTERMLTGEIAPIKKPDWDNIGKIICDSLNGVAYKDDAQITRATVIKLYSETPCVNVFLQEATP